MGKLPRSVTTKSLGPERTLRLSYEDVRVTVASSARVTVWLATERKVSGAIQ
jgi:hypothetical protein